MTTAATDPTDLPTAPSADQPQVWRVEVRPRPGEPDPHATGLQPAARKALGAELHLTSARVYLLQGQLTADLVQRIADELLTDPVSQIATLGATPAPAEGRLLEVHYKPGVMDPVAQSTEDAIAEMLHDLPRVQVRTGFRYDLPGCTAAPDALTRFAQAHLANPVIQDLMTEPYLPQQFLAGAPYQFQQHHVSIRDLDDDALRRLSREGHLFLSLEEMKAVQDYYRTVGREPTDIELETLAQTWSEHCVHKTLKSTVRYEGDASFLTDGRPGHERHADGSVTIRNLLKSTIAAATHELMTQPGLDQWCISVFKDNAGIVRFDDETAVCIKVETHNHPSAIEPYGGAATGIGGCIRDVMGTGLAGQPIANSDVFCVAPPETAPLPTGVIAPRRILEQVVAGVRDYGNRMGIPTVNGAVWFHPDYLGNPLVFAGCVGMMPLDKCFGDAQPGDRIIALGGRTGRDGIHGATFSSAELTDSHADEFSHAVQIGNAITQKKTLDVILQARDYQTPDGTHAGPLFHAITDCGAGGFSSAVGEMGAQVGALVTLETAPLKYDGLSYTEIWISEAQERMVLAVPPANVPTLRAMCEAEDVELCDLGEFGLTDEAGAPLLRLTYRGQQVGQLAMGLLHDGIPTPTRNAKWNPPSKARGLGAAVDPSLTNSLQRCLLALLRHPNLASKQWIIRQYDHEVQGGSVVKPLTGPQQIGPSDASVLRPRLDSHRAIAIANGLQTGLGEVAGVHGDSYWMTLAAIDEAVRNCVCVGADPTRIALLDNFCWPSCDKPENLGSLVRAAEACYDGALAYRAPFVSGKDSLNNQFTTEDGQVISIPPTLLITALAMVNDANGCTTMDAKEPGNLLLLVGATGSALGGSHYLALSGDDSRDSRVPQVDLKQGPANAAAVAQLIAAGLVRSAHDCSEGGLLPAAAEMAFAGGVGLELNLDGAATLRTLDETTLCFAETPSRYLLEIAPGNLGKVADRLRQQQIPFGELGAFASHQRLTVRSARAGLLLDEALADLRAAWLGTLAW